MAGMVSLRDLLKSSSLASVVLESAITHGYAPGNTSAAHFRDHVWQYMKGWSLPLGGARDAHGIRSAIVRKNTAALREAVQNMPHFGLLASEIWFNHNEKLLEQARKLAQERGMAMLQFPQDGKSGEQDPKSGESLCTSKHEAASQWPADWEPEQLGTLSEELASSAGVPVEQAKLMLFLLCSKPQEASAFQVPTSTLDKAQPQEVKPQDSLLDASKTVEQPAEKGEATSAHTLTEQEAAVHESTDRSDLFTRFLAELMALPANAPEWERLDSFFAECGELARARKQSQQARSQLGEVLARLAAPEAQEVLSALPYLSGHEGWTSDLVQEADTHVAATQIAELLELLEKAAALHKLPPPKNKEERRERAKQSEEVLEKIEQIHSALAVTFGQSSTMEEVPPEFGAQGVEGEATPIQEAPPSEVSEPEPIADALTSPKSSLQEAALLAELSSPAFAAQSVVVPSVSESEPLAVPPDLGNQIVVTPSVSPSPDTDGLVVIQVTEPSNQVVEALLRTQVSVVRPVELVTPPRRVLKAMSRQEAARALLDKSIPEARDAFFFSLIAEGDIAAAYWLARAIEAQAESSPIPSWLLAALAGSERLQMDSVVLTSGLLNITSSHAAPKDAVLQPLAMAAALPSVIRSPGSGLMNWLDTPEVFPELRDIVEPLSAFALYGLALPADSQTMLRNRAERSARIQAAIAAARSWGEEINSKRTSYIPAKQVLDHILREGGELANLVKAAEQDDRDRIEDVSTGLTSWRNQSYVEGAINEIRRKKSGNKDPIEGSAKAWIFARIEELCTLVANWHELASLDERLGKNYDWVTQQLEELRKKISRALPSALHGLETYRVREDSALASAVSAVLRRALLTVAEMLSCVPPGEVLWMPPDVALRERLLEADGGLDSLLERRLITLPGVQLPEDREGWSDGLKALFEELPREILSGGGVEECIAGWISRRNFRFVPRLLQFVEDPASRKTFEEQMRLEQDSARRALKQRMDRTRADIEQAVVDGFIGDERSDLTGRLDGIPVDSIREFNSPERVLNGISRALETARSRGLQSQREQWAKLRPGLAETSWSPEQQELAAQRIEEVLDAREHRSADELLSRLEDSLENNKEFDEALFAAPRKETRYLEEFIRVLPRMEQELTRVRGRDAPKRVQELLAATEERVEGHRDLRVLHDDWQALISARNHPDAIRKVLVKLLRQLGLQVEGEFADAVSLVRSDPHLLFQVKASSRRLSPVPHFGSRVERRLRVMCIWVQEGKEGLTSAIPHLRAEGEGTVVLYLDRLGLARRRQLSTLCRQNSAAALVIDEWLLLYIASLHEGDERLRGLFECALPFTASNPYTQRAGTVPPEMFFGREEMARELASFNGTCLVYGGRQLGKSALLEQVQRRFIDDDPSRHFSIRLDIKDVGDPATDQMPEQLWPRIREELKRVRFLAAQVSTDKPDDLVRRIGESLGGEKGRKLLILLDEADHFLDADVKRGFEQVKRLRDLMTQHPGLCKVVLAGLHNVQRFQSIANQPLAHFGRALLVGPLDAKDADALVRRPLEALGFRLPVEEKNGSVLRILSYTNYHPGLIQLFCQELVAMLQRRTDPQQQPPYLLREADVEEVYRRQDTRQLIRERFEWTLALDTRYQAVVWSLIAHQSEGRDGYSRSFSTGDILSQVRGFWRQGFEEVESDQMRGLLDEMVGLGVLIRNGLGEYRLRSPNVVRLLGSTNDIWNKLIELEKKEKPVALDEDSHHFRLGNEQPPRYSPLSYAQERLLSEPRSSVVMVLGCEATHLQYLPEALRRWLRPEKPSYGVLQEIPKNIQTPGQIRDWLKQTCNEHRTTERLLLLRELSASEARDGLLVDEAIAFCESHQQRKQWVRVIFVIRPIAGWEWTSVAVPNRPEREQVLVLPLRRWMRPALMVRLFDEADIRTADEEFRRRVLEVTTGGWPCLLSRFAQECRKPQNERKVADEMERELRPGGSRAGIFWKALELEDLPRIVDILRLVHEYSGVTPSTAFEGVLEGDVNALKDRSELLLKYLLRLGCLESRGEMLCVERRVAEALPG
ncbi:ATP-binding protein [Corallococcus carmarthensis]|uniref:ATP-binding protein n=1 Tax=Corallococcus carmarthensis TaxID=2316728 RepID=UPI00148D8B3A|nr:ATP-binding protein [Corallococcus carmarthensis]NOK17820.1 ATP-binding protein [Corallococcus carmarthensis]